MGLAHPTPQPTSFTLTKASIPFGRTAKRREINESTDPMIIEARKAEAEACGLPPNTKLEEPARAP